MKKHKKIIIIPAIILLSIILLMAAAVGYMLYTTTTALENQVNADIDMDQVKDGTYTGSSDGGLVKVKVSVEVKDHKIVDIELLEHRNGKGESAESIIDDMVSQNSDDVDVVTGATASSKTIKNAVNVALQQGIEK